MDPRRPVSHLMHLHSYHVFFDFPPVSTMLDLPPVHPFSIFALLPTESMEIAFCCPV